MLNFWVPRWKKHISHKFVTTGYKNFEPDSHRVVKNQRICNRCFLKIIATIPVEDFLKFMYNLRKEDVNLALHACACRVLVSSATEL